jgi:uncharacterized protein
MVTRQPQRRHQRGSRYGTAALFLMASLLVAVRAQGEVTVPQTGEYVVDTAGVVDAKSKAEIEGWLRELEEKTTAQVKVLTVPSTGGEDFFGFVQRHYDLWKLGKKGKGNGALIVVAVQEHKVRIHTGYGLEGVLPDSWCGSLSRKVAQEYFKRGAYGDGLKQMVVAVANRIADDAGVKLTTPQFRHQQEQSGGNGGLILFFIVVLIVIYYAYWRKRGSGGRRGYGGMIGPFPPTSYGGPWNNGSFGGGSSGGGTFGGGSWGGGGMSGGGGGGASWCSAGGWQFRFQTL